MPRISMEEVLHRILESMNILPSQNNIGMWDPHTPKPNLVLLKHNNMPP